MIPKVSVIITIYNREKYIEECARTLFEQTLDAIELLFIDDGSTDHSVDILKNLLEQYPARRPMVKIICLKHNIDMLEKLYAKAKETNADIVGCNITHEYQRSQSIFRQDYSDSMDENIRRLINGGIFPSLCTSLTKTNLIKDNHITFPQGLDTGEDLLFNLYLYLHANKISGIEDPSYHYRHTEDSSSFKHTEKSIKSVIEVARRIEIVMRETGKYSSYEKEIQFRKFSMKCALITSFDNKDYNKAWVKLFPETNEYIWSYKQFSWKQRLEFWLAAHNLFEFAFLFQKLLRWQHRIRRF